MNTITVTNDEQLESALTTTDNIDTINIMPGDYFIDQDEKLFALNQNLEIIGQPDALEQTKLYCDIAIGLKMNLTLKNLTLLGSNIDCFTLGIADGAHLKTENVEIDHRPKTNQTAVYIENASASLIDTNIYASQTFEAYGMLLMNSELDADNSFFQNLSQHNSKTYLLDCTVTCTTVQDNSKLSFTNLEIFSPFGQHDPELWIIDGGKVTGNHLFFTSNYDDSAPLIRILEGSFDANRVNPTNKNLTWVYDEKSHVMADGEIPETDGYDD